VIHLAAWQWAVAGFCGLLVGVTKTGVPGVFMLTVPLFAMVLPPRASTGALLPLLLLSDLLAIAWYRRHAVWAHLLRLLPLAAVGIALGFLALGRIGDRELKIVLGALVLVLQAVNLVRDWRYRGELPALRGFWFAAVMGVLAGFTTMLANAAGPIVMLYLLTMRLPKNQFLGTSAWFYLCLNLIKMPFSVKLGLVTPASLLFDLALAPSVVGGAFLGVLLARRLPEKVFNILIQAMTAAAAIWLFF